MSENLISLEANTDLSELKRLTLALGAAKLRPAVRMAVNDTLRWSRTRIRRSIQEVYNIKAQRINDNDQYKGLRLRLASTNDLASGQLTAGHKPVNLTSLLRTRQTKTGVSVEILKGKREIIQRAFKVGSLSNAVFARGVYGKGGFEFRYGAGERTNRPPDTPITGINTVSIATAALNVRAYDKWAAPTSKHYHDELARQISRLIDNQRPTGNSSKLLGALTSL